MWVLKTTRQTGGAIAHVQNLSACSDIVSRTLTIACVSKYLFEVWSIVSLIWCTPDVVAVSNRSFVGLIFIYIHGGTRLFFGCKKYCSSVKTALLYNPRLKCNRPKTEYKSRLTRARYGCWIDEDVAFTFTDLLHAGTLPGVGLDELNPPPPSDNKTH